MSKDNIRAGGFCAVNGGEINDCYSLVRINAGKKTAGGFFGENNGSVNKSFSFVPLKGLLGGFAGKIDGNNTDKSTISDCYFFHNEKEGSKRIQKLIDHDKSQRLSEIEKAEDITKLGFDLEEIWQYTADEDSKAKKHKSPLIFIPEKWLYDIRNSKRITEYISLSETALTTENATDNTISKELFNIPLDEVHKYAYEIKTAEELIDFAKAVNNGDELMINAYVRLTKDIDLGGKEWIPIGKERLKAFMGIFDGEGHTVSNFTIKDKKVENKGFFGFLKGEIYNLSVDCRIKGGICSGGLCAVNESGIIGYCGAIVKVKGKDGHFGGLCGRNGEESIVFQSYTAGKMILAVIPWWYGLPLIPLLVLVYLMPKVMPTGVVNPVYPPPPYDEDQVKSGDGLAPNGEGNFVSFQFEQMVDINLQTGLCLFNFKNPGNSNHDIIVQLQFTDAQAKRVMGGTGRTPEEQAEIEATPGYDPEVYRCVIAESKAIRPGYQLDELKLVEFKDGAVLPSGEYNAVVYLVFYDIVTHDRAMLESQLPVVISVHE